MDTPLTRYCSAVLLAGGQSIRFGSDKYSASLCGRPVADYGLSFLCSRFGEVFVSGSTNWSSGVPLLADREPSAGPLAGVAAALSAARHQWLFVLAADMPFPDCDVVDALRAAASTDSDAIVIPSWHCGLEPLFGFYSRDALPAIECLLKEGVRQVRHLSTLVPTLFYDLTAEGIPRGRLEKCFFNINSPADLERAERLIQNAEGGAV